jgi:hypothetical protein
MQRVPQLALRSGAVDHAPLSVVGIPVCGLHWRSVNPGRGIAVMKLKTRQFNRALERWPTELIR